MKVTVQSKCEDCGQKQPTWNVPGAAGNKYRWCAECGQKHAGAVKVKVGLGPKSPGVADVAMRVVKDMARSRRPAKD